MIKAWVDLAWTEYNLWVVERDFKKLKRNRIGLGKKTIIFFIFLSAEKNFKQFNKKVQVLVCFANAIAHLTFLL